MKTFCAADDNIVWSLCISPDGMMVASGSDRGIVRVWDMESGACVTLNMSWPHPSGVRSLCYTPDGEHLISADTKLLVVWKTQSNEVLFFEDRNKWNNNDFIFVHALPDSKSFFTVNCESGCSIWDMRSGQHKQSFILKKEIPRGSLCNVP